MAIEWADFPSGQRGLYGTNTARMLNGIWAEVNGGTLVADPDPSVEPGGIVFKGGASELFPAIRGARFAYPTVGKTKGFSVRIWMEALPTENAKTAVIALKNAANATLVCFRILSNGSVEFRTSEDGGSGVQLGVTPGPVLTANAFNRVEVKCFSDAAVGTIELRVNGVHKLTVAGANTSGQDFAQIHLGHNCGFSSNAGVVAYFKDLILWNTLGAECNDFLGNLAVYDLVPDNEDDIGGWTRSFGADGSDLIRDEYPANTLTATGAINDGDTVRIDNTYYRFSTAALDSGAPAGTAANPWRVLIGASVAEAMENLHHAIGATGVAGADYSTALTAHTSVDQQGFTPTTVGIVTKLLTSTAIVTTETGANLAWVSGTPIDGPTDSSYISADNTPPAAAKFTLTDLPDDVIAVKAVLPIGRMVKTDGGDCTVEMAVTPNDIDFDAGDARPLTLANTFYWDVSHLSPDTAAPWTPNEVDDMLMQFDRTL